jgi:hypothetical protein
MTDPGCDYTGPGGVNPRCRRTPTEPLALGTVFPDADDVVGHGGKIAFGHFCSEHLPIMRERLGGTARGPDPA